MKKNAIFIMIFSLVLVSGNFALAQDQGPSQRPVNPGINNNGPKSSNRNPGQGLDKGKQGPKSNKDAKPGKPNPVDNKNKAMPNQNNAAQKEGPNSDMQKPRDDGRAMPENINLFTTNTATSTGEQEKISNPQDMKSFEKIKKVGNALYGTRKDGIQKPAFIKPEVAQCVKDAISKKSTAIKAAVSAHDQTALTSIDVRTTCELSAIDKTTAQDQSDANQLCIDTDQKIKNDNESTFEKARETVQKTFQTDVKNCISTPLDTNASSSVNVIK